MARPSTADHPSLEGCAGAIVGFTVVYLGIEAARAGDPHPMHWLITFIGAAIGYAIGHGIYLWREGRLRLPPSIGRSHGGRRTPTRSHGERNRRR